MNRYTLIILAVFGILSGCSKCDENQAYNKMLALQKVQARIAAQPGDGGPAVAQAMANEAGVVGELIAKNDYSGACAKAVEISKKYGIDLEKEQQDMVTIEELKADGGKGSGSCSVADAAKKQMEVHSLLQKEVDAGKKSPDVFRDFNRDTQGFAEMLSTDPSKACKLLDDLKKKYGVS